MRGMLYRVEGIVIRSVPYGEGNVIITLFTEEYGKIGLMIRGAKKARSRHAAVSQLHTYGMYVFYKGNANSLGTLNDAETLQSFSEIRSDLRTSAYAAYFAELVDRFVPDGEASGYLYLQLLAAYEALQSGKDPAIISFLLELKLFHFAGISPITHACARCGGGLQPGERVAWSAQTGGLLFGPCATSATDAMELPPAAAQLLPVLQRADLRRIGQVNVKPETKALIKQALRRWMDVHGGVTVKSRTVLDQIEAVYEM